jgi:hypothetical protein
MAGLYCRFHLFNALPNKRREETWRGQPMHKVLQNTCVVQAQSVRSRPVTLLTARKTTYDPDCVRVCSRIDPNVILPGDRVSRCRAGIESVHTVTQPWRLLRQISITLAVVAFVACVYGLATGFRMRYLPLIP